MVSDKMNIGFFNWYVNVYYLTLGYLHSNQFNAAYKIHLIGKDHSLFNKQPSVIKELFLINDAFIHFLLLIKKLAPQTNKSDFRVSKFLNEVPEYSKDKKAFNISILIAQVLFLLSDRKYNKIIDRMESLQLYAYRHLRNDETIRSQCFIKMLGEMVKADFRRTGTEFRTNKLLQKMKDALAIDPFLIENEVIPYEDLWEMILEQLD